MRVVKVGVAAGVAAGALIIPTACTPSPLTCTARVTVPYPPQYSTETVVVQTRPNANILTVAQYRTASTAHQAVANSSGAASIPYMISDATKNYAVVVNVLVAINGQTGSCSTSFTPR
jgi:hypothetical protein